MTARDGLLRLLQAAEAAGANPRPARGDEYRAIGLCHGGSTIGSLALHYDPARGKAWVNCFAGCDRDRTLDALGLVRADLWDEPLHRDATVRPRPAVRPARPAAPDPQIFEAAPFGWTPPVNTWMPCGHVKSAEYVYYDENGRVLFGVGRCPSKDFAQWRPVDSKSGRRWSLIERDSAGTVVATVRYVPFRLRQLLDAVAAGTPVFLVEGEKDALAVAEAGAAATTVAGGASKWKPQYAEFFTGADVTIVADRDVPGRRHAQQLVDALLPVAARLKVAIAMSGKDAHDHISAGFALDDFKTIWTPSRAENGE